MTKEEAIEILKDYLTSKRRIDTSDDPHLFLDRIQEHNYCWEIPHTTKEYIKSQDFSLTPVGAGPYLIDKENGKIYLTGSAPVDWIKDFELMRSGQKHEWRWKELRNEFLDVQFEMLPERNLVSKIETVKNEQKNSFIESVFRTFKEENGNGLSPIIKRLEYNEFQSTFLIGYPEGSVIRNKTNLELLKIDELTSISLHYCLEPYFSFVGPLNEIKSWLKLNPEYKATDNYWIEEMEKDLSKPFNQWNLKMSLEIHHTN